MPPTTIAAATRIVGSIETDGDLVVEGHVDGSIRATGIIRLASTAEVTGELHAQRVIIDDGALFEGQVKLVRGAVTKALPAPTPVRVVPELHAPGRQRIQRRHA